MHQYTFEATAPNGVWAPIRCTAPDPEWARAQVAHAYQGWTVRPEPSEIQPPHHCLGEIDASDMTQDDYEYITRT